MVSSSAIAADEARTRYWRRTRSLTLALLAVWGGCSFAVLFFARELAGLTVFGWPFSFYMAAQGLTLGYLLLTGVYVAVMRRLDRLLAKETAHGR